MTSSSKTTPIASQLVCIVHRDPTIRKKLSGLLIRGQYQTKCFADGNKFLENIDKLSPACLIVGQDLSTQSGNELMADLKRLGYSLPTIMLSQKSNVPIAVRAIHEGAADFIEIPWVDRKLLDTVNKLAQH